MTLKEYIENQKEENKQRGERLLNIFKHRLLGDNQNNVNDNRSNKKKIRKNR